MARKCGLPGVDRAFLGVIDVGVAIAPDENV